ncbi:arginase family protein [Glutamicibacter halophytocola]|uniref:arginase family protein n=1 Tax=Glutamicibacter halophytocola TaxID=1933880 RepID=UPI001892B967|nr:arginase family protein [Glutamicibacter halophytocola]
MNPNVRKIAQSSLNDQIMLSGFEGDEQVYVSTSTIRLIERFAIATCLDNLLADVVNAGHKQVLIETVEGLFSRGILVDAIQASSSSRLSRGVFGSPLISLENLSEFPFDVVVLGVPSDSGATYRKGSQFGPNEVRKYSSVFLNCGPTGVIPDIHDPRGEISLSGMRIGDLGDLLLPFPEGTHEAKFGQIAEAVSRIFKSGAIPVMLGGDHSITLGAVNGLSQECQRKLGIIHIDAHYDYHDARFDSLENVHHGNFLGWIVSNQRVAQVVQIGQRQITPTAPKPHPKVKNFSSSSIFDYGIEHLVEELSDDLFWYITIDVDVLDPSVMPATGTVLPGGWGFNELVMVVTSIARSLRVIGFDIVEFSPNGGEVEPLIISELLLRAINSTLENNA